MPIYKNWKDPEAYNFTEKLSLLGWAWELLRRNEEYQQDWLYKMKKFFSGERMHEMIEFYREVEGRDIIKDRTFSINNPGLKINPYRNIDAEKYGTYFLFNPKQDRPFPDVFTARPSTFRNYWNRLVEAAGVESYSESKTDKPLTY